MVKESKKYIAGNVICQWISLVANISMMGAIAKMLQSLFEGTAGDGQIALTAVVAVVAVIVRFICTTAASRMGYLSSKAVKRTLREMIYKKLLRLGSSYKQSGGTGLGLSIVKHAVQYHHGKIAVESEPNNGTTISVLFDTRA